MATGLSSRPIRVGDLVTVDQWYIENYFRTECGHSGVCVVLATGRSPRIAKVRLMGTHQVGWLPCVAFASGGSVVELIIDDKGNFDTTDLSKDDITIIQGYINELSK